MYRNSDRKSSRNLDRNCSRVDSCCLFAGALIRQNAKEQGMEYAFGTPLQHRNRKGGALRTGNTQLAQVADRDLRAAKLASYIRELADITPPLNAEQRMALAGLLVGGQQ
jgi:hypothetical protein